MAASVRWSSSRAKRHQYLQLASCMTSSSISLCRTDEFNPSTNSHALVRPQVSANKTPLISALLAALMGLSDCILIDVRRQRPVG